MKIKWNYKIMYKINYKIVYIQRKQVAIFQQKNATNIVSLWTTGETICELQNATQPVCECQLSFSELDVVSVCTLLEDRELDKVKAI